MLRNWGNQPSVRCFNETGQLLEFNYLNEPLFSSIHNFKDLTFTPSFTFAANSYGLFSFDGTLWSQETASNNARFLASDADTVWMLRTNLDYIKWENGVVSQGNTGQLRRIAAKNGIKWISTSESDIIGSYDEGGGVTFHSPDTSTLMSWNNYDFKFARNSDSLFSSSDLGISIAYNGFFVDSISSSNTLNMPTGSIIEFEFDQDDNIWAVFAPDNMQSTPSSVIAFLNRSLGQWTEIIDSNNSPIPFGNRITIELDTADNLWVCDMGNIYVRKINNWADWLKLEELTSGKKELIKVVDLMGRKTQFKPNTPLIYIYSDGSTKKVFRIE